MRGGEESRFAVVVVVVVVVGGRNRTCVPVSLRRAGAHRAGRVAHCVWRWCGSVRVAWVIDYNHRRTGAATDPQSLGTPGHRSTLFRLPEASGTAARMSTQVSFRASTSPAEGGLLNITPLPPLLYLSLYVSLKRGHVAFPSLRDRSSLTPANGFLRFIRSLPSSDIHYHLILALVI